MKRLLLCSLFLFPFFSEAQSPNFFVDGARWVYSTIESQEPGQEYYQTETEQNLINGDTVISLISYKKLYTNKNIVIHMLSPCCNTYYLYESYEQYLRYDSSALKVYFKDSVTAIERLIYDFNLSVGDTVPMQDAYIPVWGIDSIANTTFFGYPSKKYYLTYPGDSTNYIIEGMGGSNGLAYCHSNEIVVSGGIFMTTLECFQLGDSIYSPSGNSCPFVTTINELNKSNIKIYPNLTRDVLNVECKVQNAELKIYDMMGRIEMEQQIRNQKSEIRINLPAGVYFVRVGNYTQKLVIE